MPTVNPRDSEYQEGIEPGNALVVTVPAGGSALVRRFGPSGLLSNATVAAGTSQTFGPYQQQCRIGVTAFAVPCTVAETISDPALANIVVSSSAPSNADGRPDGTIYIQTA